MWITLVASAELVRRDDLVFVLRSRRPSRQLMERVCVGDHRRCIDEISIRWFVRMVKEVSPIPPHLPPSSVSCEGNSSVSCE